MNTHFTHSDFATYTPPKRALYSLLMWIVPRVTEATYEAVDQGREFSDLSRKALYQTHLPEDGKHYHYAEVGMRHLMFKIPKRFDDWGYDEFGGKFGFGFCVMDDFGNAVEVDPFCYQVDGYLSILVPDYANPPAKGEPYKYVELHQTVH